MSNMVSCILYSPKRPEEFVCTDCRAIFAGTPVGDDPDDLDYEKPTECSACGGTDFVAIGMFGETQHQS